MTSLTKIKILLGTLLINIVCVARNIVDTAVYANPVKVACVGASTTYGANIPNQPLKAYPAQLGSILGDKWDVRNFGVNSTGVLKKGDFPYWNTKAFKAAQAFNPDVVILMLGGNDVKPQNWKYKADFIADYKEIIRVFRNLPSHPKIYICREVPVFQDRWGITAKVVNEEEDSLKIKLAKKEHLPLIDLYTPLIEKSFLFEDGIHPNEEGAGIMAKTIAKKLTGKELKVISAVYPGRKSKWFGFDCYDFQYDLLEAKLVLPHTAAHGNPWVWNACFFGWHPQMDSILLSKGFAVFYLNTNDMFGSAEAMHSWNQLYNYLTGYYQFNKKLALEGVSRGGLYVYNFAKLFPERVSCLYAEAPVCDIKSWPGGFKKAPGDTAEWKKLLKALHLTQEQALLYKGNPIDSLEKIARYQIPVWHSIGLNDALVPPEENTFLLADKYIRLGGIITICPNTKTPPDPNWQGHHFQIDDPAAGANFIMYNYFKSADQ